MGIRSSMNKIYDLLSKHLPSNALRIGCQRAKGVRIGRNVYLAYDVSIDMACPELVEIGESVRIGIGVIILAHNRPSDGWLAYLGQVQQKVCIRRHAVVSAGAIILPGVTVGEFAIVREGAVVREDVPSFTVVAGVPARVIENLPRDQARDGVVGHGDAPP
ncbi:serine O-acetyltransferase [Candidatus Methylomirabilis lanthanidiphila]|uniref:Serine O-acetyltransferase n=1 Tax=Candidatus Methylomirabilis lanthanidiphila TaxID=2211376 RepID=A0A564ZHT3_9BACT|nr:serine O-acetyltransferase [Candidatus Methylomirabilis lanthanidiphila]